MAGRTNPVPARTPAGTAGVPRRYPLLAAGTRVSPAPARCSPRRGCRNSPRAGSRRRWFHRQRCIPGGRPGSGVRLRGSRCADRTGWASARQGRRSRGTTRRERVAVAGRLAASRAASAAVLVTAGRPVPAATCLPPVAVPASRAAAPQAAAPQRRPRKRRPRRRRPFMGPAKWPAWTRSPRWRHLRKR